MTSGERKSSKSAHCKKNSIKSNDNERQRHRHLRLRRNQNTTSSFNPKQPTLTRKPLLAPRTVDADSRWTSIDSRTFTALTVENLVTYAINVQSHAKTRSTFESCGHSWKMMKRMSSTSRFAQWRRRGNGNFALVSELPSCS